MEQPTIDRDALEPILSAELARRDVLEFAQRMNPDYQRARHLNLIAERLEALERRDTKRLIIATPPRHGKSELVSRYFPAWCLGRRPKSNVILCSYGSELAEGNSRRVRDLANDSRYPFEGVHLREDSRAANRWQTTAGGVLVAAGIGSGLTGFGGDLVVIDDPVRDREAAESAAVRDSTWTWYQDVLRTRLHPDAIMVVVSTRWHEDDLVGRILASPDGANWSTLVLPAISDSDRDPLGRAVGEALWPERFPVRELPSVERGEISSRSFAALYQQRPAPATGNIFRRDWFNNRYTMLPGVADTFIAVDAAAKTGIGNDFSVAAVVATDFLNVYVLDIIRERVEFGDLCRLVLNADMRYHPRCVYIEDASSGTPLIQELRSRTGLPVIGVPPRGSKIARAEAVTTAFESGRVLFPNNASWLEPMIEEFASFPNGRHDDQVDALTLAVGKAREATARHRHAERRNSALASLVRGLHVR